MMEMRLSQRMYCLVLFYDTENAKATTTFMLHALEVSRVYNYKLASIIYHAIMGLYH